jgi:hypothetical protein
MAIATAAGAAPVPASVVFTPGTGDAFGQGASGTVAITGTGFAADGGNVTITSSAPGLTFTDAAEASSTAASANYASTSATVPGTYSISITDDNGTDTVTGLVVVNADPTFTSVSPTSIVDLATPTATPVTVTGTGFVSGATVTFTNSTNGTTLASDAGGTFTSGKAAATVVTATSGTATTASTTVTVTATPSSNVTGFTVTGTGVSAGTTVTAGGGTTTLTLSQAATISSGTTLTFTSPGTQGSSTGSGTSLTVEVDPTNSVTGGPATVGTYTVTVTNPDGGSVTSGAVFTVNGNEISEVTPSAVGVTTGVASSTPITVSGSGFSSTATLALDSTCVTDGVSLGTATPTTTAITDTLIVDAAAATTAAGAPFQCSLTVANVTPGNGATYTATHAIGIGEASAIAPTITASSLSTAAAVLAGAPAQTITFTGTGFSQFTSPVDTVIGTTTTVDSHASIGAANTSCLGGQTGTTLTCELTVSSGAATGAHGAVLENTAAQTTFPAAFSVAGPVITSAAPVALAVGAPVGTVVALTGTGFGPTTTGAITASVGTAPTGVFQNVSATQENFVVTSPPTGTSTDSITVSSVDAYGASSASAPFAFAVEAAPSVSSTTYATGTTGVGVGAKAQVVTVNGSGFSTGATIGSFVNAAGVADPDVTGTVSAVNAAGTQLTAAITVATGDTNAIDGFTVTNTNGGTTKATAAVPAGLVLDAAPTITTLSPVTATPAATTAFTITGTGFQTGATVVLSSDGTCGTATVASATSITVSCTIGSPGAAAVTLSVVNPDGGRATSGTILAATTTKPATTFHVTGAHGTAIAGKTVTMTISGTGFYGQPKITSTAVGTKVGVSKDSGKVLTIRVTTKAGIRGEHTFTIRLANGKTAKANYAVKA